MAGLLHNPKFTGLTVGTVVDTDDPQQTGRLKILVPSYGDRPNVKKEDLPWARYVSPLGGITSGIARGPEQDEGQGAVAYGFWNIPKVGAAVIVSCIDGSPAARLWIGCLHTERLNNTLPHGRFMQQDDGELSGPLDSTEQPIEPLYSNMTNAFGGRLNNYEWRTRGGDYTATATADNYYRDDLFCKVPDAKDQPVKTKDGNTTNIRQGYAQSQINRTTKNYDSQVYSWTTPGFHSISMDDRPENCRMKFRTTAGHQIILDDTNERIYINTPDGNSWVELDQDGNIDVYSSVKVNVRTDGDINLTAAKSIRMYAGEAIHMYTANMHIETSENYNVLVGTEGKITTGGTLHLTAGGQILGKGTQIHLNGPTPTNADSAKWVNRIPAHEPWGRCTTKSDAGETRTLEPKFDYDSPLIGREDKVRNPKWLR